MAIDIRPVFAAEIPAWDRSKHIAFLRAPTVTDEYVAWRAQYLDPARTRGAWDGPACVGTLRTFATTLSIPGGAQVDADALTNVTVTATHRRQGLLRRMLSASLREAKERGEVISILRAAEWPIYSRFGYWPSSETAAYRVRCDRRATLRGPDDSLVLRTVTREQAVEFGVDIYARMREQAAGHIHRGRDQWEMRLGVGGAPYTGREPVCVGAFSADGAAQGLLAWIASDGEAGQEPITVTVLDLITATDDAYHALWSYLLHLDLVTEIAIHEAAVDQALPWLLDDGRLMKQTYREDDVWLRILDLPAAMSARRYASTDRLVLQVIDDDIGGYAAGTYVLDGGPEHGDCRSSGESADLTLSQRALSGLYLGGFSVRSQQLAGLIDEQTPGAAARLAAMMHTDRRPWNATGF